MTKILKFLAALLFALPLFAQAQSNYHQAELDQMLAPIALYPDPLLSQVLMAATYPRDVVEAADWSRAHPGLQGDDAVRAAQEEDWDPSVKSLVAFPQVLARMNERIDWTRDLGDAFLGQEAQVMDTVQQLRQRAQAAGNLQSDERMLVQRDGLNISLQLVSARTAYVPYYDPMVIYGTWWWPAYRPVVWAPWPGYARHYHPGYPVGFWWGGPVSLSPNFFYGGFDWYRREVQVVNVHNYYYRPAFVANRIVATEHGHWQHDPRHRRDVEYRHAEVRQRYAHVQSERHEAQRDDRRMERRVDRQDERRDDRRADHRLHAPAAASPQAQPTPHPRAEQRDDRRADHRPHAAAAASPQAQPTPQPRAEQRDDRRAERQAAMEAQHQARARQQVQESQRQAERQQARQQAQEAQRQAQQQQARQQAQEAQRLAQHAQEAQRQAQHAQEAQRQAQQQQARQQAQEAQRLAQHAQEAQRQAQEKLRQQAQEAQRQSRPEHRPSMPAAIAPQQPRAERHDRRDDKRDDKRDDRRDDRREQHQERGQRG